MEGEWKTTLQSMLGTVLLCQAVGWTLLRCPRQAVQSVGNRIKLSPETLYHHRLHQILWWCQWVSAIYCGR